MTFSLECRACGHSNRVDSSLVGKMVQCRRCGVALVVSPPRQRTDAPPGPVAHLKFNCPTCGKELATRPELAGKKIRCKGCQKVVLVPAGAAAPAERPARGPVRTHGESAKVETSPCPASQPDRERNPGRATPAPTRPDLELSDYAVFAPRGDFGAITPKGADEPVEKVEPLLPPRVQSKEQMRQKGAAQADEDPALTRALAAAKKRKRKAKRKGLFDLKETLRLIGGILGLVLVVSFLAWGYPYFRWPLGIMLVSLGFLTYFMGVVSLQELLAAKAAVIVLLFRLFPPFQWLVLATRWAEAKDFAPFFVAGALTVGLGCGFIATAPGGKKADKAAKITRRRGQPVAQSKVPPTPGAPKEQAKPAAITPKAEAPPPAGTPKEQAKPAGRALSSAPLPASAPTPAQAQPKLPARPTPALSKPPTTGKSSVAFWPIR